MGNIMNRGKLILLWAISFMSSIFVSCQQEQYNNTSEDINISAIETGNYHNEILKNYIEIKNIPSSLNTSNESQEFIKLMADYGNAIRLAYKNNPPTGDIDNWVYNILNITYSPEFAAVNVNLSNGVLATKAISNVFGNSAMPQYVSLYLDEMERIAALYGGTDSYKPQEESIFLRYYMSSTDKKEKELLENMHSVAQGSHEYWDKNYQLWNPKLAGRFWSGALNVGKNLLIADVSGVVAYFCAVKLYPPLGAFTWKGAAATAAGASIAKGVEMLLSEILSKSYYDVGAQNISIEEIYAAYILRKDELSL